MSAIDIRDFEPADRDWARELIGGFQGGDHRVARLGELVDPLEQPGIVAELDGQRAGLLTAVESPAGFEVLSLNSARPGRGVGTRLLETAVRVASASGASRLWLVTTGDNLPAVGFYLRRGFGVSAVHAGAVDADRRSLKPTLPERGHGGIPIRDYVELELPVTDDGRLPFRRLPRIEDIDRLPPEAAADALRPLFEHAPAFLERLASARPFGDDGGLIAAARELARGLTEAEQVELLAAHPRIGADPATVSRLSHAEQGYDDDGPADPEPWIADELDALNDAYERVFGFRFVVFVAGRPRSEIVPILERSLRDERISELRRGIDDVVHIAADRLARLRGGDEAVSIGQPAGVIGG